MTQDEFLSELIALGFRYHSTASPRWRVAMFHRNGAKTLVILARRRGIDMLETPLQHSEMINESGLLSVSMQRAGDRFVELSYIDSEVSIHNQILEAVSVFSSNQEIADAHFVRQGMGPTEWGAKYGDKSKIGEDRSASSEMKDIYYAASSGDGGSAYLGDGMWISPSGSIEDRE